MSTKVVEKKRKRVQDDLLNIEATEDETEPKEPKPLSICDEMLISAVNFALRPSVPELLHSYAPGNGFATYRNMLELLPMTFLVKLATSPAKIIAGLTAEGVRRVVQRFKEHVDDLVGTFASAYYIVEDLTLAGIILLQLEKIMIEFATKRKVGEFDLTYKEWDELKSYYYVKRDEWEKEHGVLPNGEKRVLFETEKRI